MIYQQDWLMRQIEAMIQAILAVALGISANEQTATQIEDSSYGKMLEKMIDDGDICAAEDLLFNDLDQSDLSWLQIALDFYSKLNNCSDDYLAMHDFSREEIDQGLFGKQLVHTLVKASCGFKNSNFWSKDILDVS